MIEWILTLNSACQVRDWGGDGRRKNKHLLKKISLWFLVYLDTKFHKQKYHGNANVIYIYIYTTFMIHPFFQ